MWALEEAGGMRVDSGQAVLGDSLLNSDSLTHRWLMSPASQDRAGLFGWSSQPHPYRSLIPENKVGVPHQVVLLQGGRPLPGPETGLLSNTQKWIVWGDTCLTKPEVLLGKGTCMESSRVREPRTALPHCSQWFYGDGISFQVVFSWSFWLRVFPAGAHLVQPRWMSERRILGGGRTRGVSFWPFLNSFGWWWLISSVFLTRTSCHKTTHANGYCGSWPGWAVSVSMLPLTVPLWFYRSGHSILHPLGQILPQPVLVGPTSWEWFLLFKML